MALRITSTLLLLLFILVPAALTGQTSLEEIISDMSESHEGRPHGVPSGYDWALGPRIGAETPPEGWEAAIAWGQLYEWIGGSPATNTRVQIRDMEMYYLSKTDFQWHELQWAVEVSGAAYVEDFAGDVNKPADKRNEGDGSVSVTCGEGYNFHFWPKQGRINFPVNNIKGCYITVRARLILDDPNGVDDRDSARYVMGVGGDWWESLTAVWDNWTTNQDMGIGRFRFVTREWKSFNMITLPADSVRKYPPPYHSAGPFSNTRENIADSLIYLDTAYSTAERVEDLLGRMTLEEKVGQMTQATWQSVNPATDMAYWKIGSLLNGGGGSPAVNTPEGWANMIDGFQVHALRTPLGIPYIYGTDAVHGHNNLHGAVIFPHNIGMGCTRNLQLVEQAARITAIEVAASGADWTFGPCVTVPQDERWGRSYEGFSENSELAAEMGAAAVRGFQGTGTGGPGLADSTTILACPKHYLGDGGTTGGDDQGDTQVSEEELRRIHLPPYIAAIGAGSGSIMASYNSWNGEKLHGHRYLLTTLLKEELGFNGFIVSDWAAIDQIPGSYLTDIETSINAGIDMVMVPENYRTFINGLVSLVRDGKIGMERIDDANRRILNQKFEMGLFEAPFTHRTMAGLVGSPGHREVARQCVRESLVVLKNKNRILPLAEGAGHLHVAGRSADNLGYQCGGWSISWQGGSGDITIGTTILEAIRAVAGGEVSYTEAGYSPDADGAEAAVVVIGEAPYAEGSGDRSSLGLSQADIQAVKSLYDRGFKVVTILVSGRPLILEEVWHYSDAVIAAWLPGTEGTGIADILFGGYQPSGKLSFTWPAGMEQIPINFGDTLYEPFLPFGYGIDTFSLPGASDPPVPFSALTGPHGSLIELTFDKPVEVPEASLIILTVNNLPEGIAEVSRKEDDSNTLLITPFSVLSGKDLILVGSGGGIVAEDGSVSAPFSLEVINTILDYHAIPGRIEAEDYSAMYGIQTEDCSDEGGGLNVGYIESGDNLTYYADISEKGRYSIQYRVASGSDGGQIRLQVQDETWHTLHTVTFGATGGWQDWITVEDTATLPAGKHTLRLLAMKSGFNINWIEFLPEAPVSSGSGEEGFRIDAWPNPAGGVLHLRSQGGETVGYTLHDASGRIAVSGEFTAAASIDLAGLSPGIYLARFLTGNRSIYRKIVVR